MDMYMDICMPISPFNWAYGPLNRAIVEAPDVSPYLLAPALSS